MKSWCFIGAEYEGWVLLVVSYEKQLQAEEEAYQQARRRLYQEIQEEKERLAQQASRQRQEIDKVTLDQEQSHNRVLDNLRAEYDKAAQDKDSKHKVSPTVSL